jgi:RHS repeat-associated protein
LQSLSATQTGGESQKSWKITYLYDEYGRPYGGIYRDPADTSSPVFFGMVVTDRGDVVELLDANGDPFAAYRYDAWGNPIGNGNLGTGIWSQTTGLITDQTLANAIATRQPLRYASYCFDSESGMYYLSSRHYDPATRQFLSKDLSRNDGEQSAYQYCGGNPVKYVDPSGYATMTAESYRLACYRALRMGNSWLARLLYRSYLAALPQRRGWQVNLSGLPANGRVGYTNRPQYLRAGTSAAAGRYTAPVSVSDHSGHTIEGSVQWVYHPRDGVSNVEVRGQGALPSIDSSYAFRASEDSRITNNPFIGTFDDSKVYRNKSEVYWFNLDASRYAAYGVDAGRLGRAHEISEGVASFASFGMRIQGDEVRVANPIGLVLASYEMPEYHIDAKSPQIGPGGYYIEVVP